MKILLVEDDALLAGEIAAALRRENFAVDTAADGEEGHHLGDTETYDAAVLDLGLPKMPGASVLRAWRKSGRQLPVLILTARDGWTEKVDGCPCLTGEPSGLRACPARAPCRADPCAARPHWRWRRRQRSGISAVSGRRAYLVGRFN
jgi:CheY-like chemotaxis protein